MRKWLIALVVIVLIAGAIFFFRSGQVPQTRVPFKRIDMKEAVYGIGTLTANNIYQLKLGVTATVEALFKREGAKVRKGDDLISVAGFSTFKAPFAGTVTSVSAKPGENVGANLPILTLTDLNDLYLAVRLDQAGVAKVRALQVARINFEAIKDKVFTGKVTTIYPNGGDFIVQVSVDNPSSILLPGMTADVGIEVDEKTHIIAVPIWALSSNDKMTIVSKSGAKREIAFKPGISSEDMVEIQAEGIEDGDELLTFVKAPKSN